MSSTLCDDDGLLLPGAVFTHGSGERAVEIHLEGTKDQRIAYVDGVKIITEPTAENPVLPVQPLVCPELAAARRFVLVVPSQAAWLYTEGMVTVPNETIDCPGTWLCFVVPGFEDEVLASVLTLDDKVATINRRFMSNS